LRDYVGNLREAQETLRSGPAQRIAADTGDADGTACEPTRRW